MPDISHSEAPLFVLSIFLIALLLVGLFAVINIVLEKKNFPQNKFILKNKHDKLIKKGKFKKAIYLCYSYLKTVEDDKLDEYFFVYDLISRDFFHSGSILDSFYFAEIANKYLQRIDVTKDSLSENIKTPGQEIQSRLAEMETRLSTEEKHELSIKIKLFDEQKLISYPNL